MRFEHATDVFGKVDRGDFTEFCGDHRVLNRRAHDTAVVSKESVAEGEAPSAHMGRFEVNHRRVAVAQRRRIFHLEVYSRHTDITVLGERGIATGERRKECFDGVVAVLGVAREEHDSGDVDVLKTNRAVKDEHPVKMP